MDKKRLIRKKYLFQRKKHFFEIKKNFFIPIINLIKKNPSKKKQIYLYIILIIVR